MGATVGTPVGVELRTSDTQRARAFYGPLLGWDFAAADGAVDCVVDRAVIARVRADGTDPGQWRVLLAANGVAGLVDRAERAGGTVLGMTSDAVGDVVDVVDPLGATFAAADVAERGPLDPGTARASWFEIMTSDAAATDRFYREVFGYDIEPPEGVGPGGPFALLRCGARTIGGRLALPPELRASLGDRWMTYFAVPDVDDVTARVTELGGTVLTPPRDAPTGRVAAVGDRSGAIFTLLTPRAPR